MKTDQVNKAMQDQRNLLEMQLKNNQMESN